ncbi:MAG: acetate/propionate family kinase [Desulfitobacteriaceae bacterium]
MRILVINCGGTSIKYQLISWDPDRQTVKARGSVENIGASRSLLKYVSKAGHSRQREIEAQDHASGLQAVLSLLIDPEVGAIADYSVIDAVGHRVVQAGENFRGSFLIDEKLIAELYRYIELAPLHNPANIKGIEACKKLMPNVPQVAVFDNAFHKDIPAHAYIYALPYEYYEKYGIRRYGFHGISFKYMTDRAAELLNLDIGQKRVISLMLGSGTTINAMAYGRSIDVSTGLSPTEGLIQSTRSGDLDPTVITYIMRKEGLGPDEMDKILNCQSGWLGISGVSNNLRLIEEAAEQGNYRARLALDAFAYRVKKYIGAYAAVMGGIDLLLFAGGAGENSALVRAKICEGLNFLGIDLDPERNHSLRGEGLISEANASTPVLVVKTDEEMVIAKETHENIQNSTFNIIKS